MSCLSAATISSFSLKAKTMDPCSDSMDSGMLLPNDSASFCALFKIICGYWPNIVFIGTMFSSVEPSILSKAMARSSENGPIAVRRILEPCAYVPSASPMSRTSDRTYVPLEQLSVQSASALSA